MKIFTAACLIASLLLCFVFMDLMAQAGNRHLPRAAKLAALPKMEFTLALIILCVIGATFGSIAIVRKARREYRQEAMDNMKALIEATKAKADEESGA